ncbi:Hypothetical_protein [Hexamita inflata]|uniref:Hypothetical_protein n=1 Tax=Hexamita inflata TaxID=28002 RepID=A0AA86NPY3_9EUKA|nr:Hypothetical protein HINF_LOCUS10776 [Hexamita inflata]
MRRQSTQYMVLNNLYLSKSVDYTILFNAMILFKHVILALTCVSLDMKFKTHKKYFQNIFFCQLYNQQNTKLLKIETTRQLFRNNNKFNNNQGKLFNSLNEYRYDDVKSKRNDDSFMYVKIPIGQTNFSKLNQGGNKSFGGYKQGNYSYD